MHRNIDGHFDAESNERCDYEALSYTWGAASNCATIYVVSQLQTWSLVVTWNCEQALRYVRHPKESRIMWIDAICINQADPGEKGRQVSIMGSIFSKASQVMVWIGPASNNSGLAMRWMDKVGAEVNFDQSTGMLKTLTKTTTRVDSSLLLASKDELSAFTALLGRIYFGRLWVWQEIRMGGRRTRLKCGKEEIFFHKLLTAVTYSAIKWHAIDSVAFKDIKGVLGVRLRFIETLPLYAQFDSLDALDLLRYCRCTDERDRLFISFAFGDSHPKNYRVLPDYTRPVEDVFTGYILRHLHVAKDLGFLDYIDGSVASDHLGVSQRHPTWIPEWTEPKLIQRLQWSLASYGSNASIVSSSSTRLILRGVLVDTVDKVSQLGPNSHAENETGMWSQARRQCLRHALPLRPSHELLTDVALMLSSFSCADRFEPPRTALPSLREFELFLNDALTFKDTPTTYTLEARKRIFPRFGRCEYRSLFTTAQQRVGLGPEIAEHGDLLVVLLGSSFITVLRPLEHHTGQYRVVGASLCTGLVDGEALLGPLPNSHERAWIYDHDTKGYECGFRNRQTGKVEYQDPRLPPLPQNWEDVSAEYKSPLPWYRNKVTEEIRGYGEDPRLDADALQVGESSCRILPRLKCLEVWWLPSLLKY